MSDTTTLTLPEQLDITQVVSIKDRMDKALAKDVTKIEVKANKVERVDSAGIQLLLSFKAAAIEDGRVITFQKPSEEMMAGTELLGAVELLELE